MPEPKFEIWSFSLTLTEEQKVLMPYNHGILSATAYDDSIFVHAVVDTVDPTWIQRTFKIYQPNRPVPQTEMGHFLATVLIRGKPWHVFHGRISEETYPAPAPRD